MDYLIYPHKDIFAFPRRHVYFVLTGNQRSSTTNLYTTIYMYVHMPSMSEWSRDKQCERRTLAFCSSSECFLTNANLPNGQFQGYGCDIKRIRECIGYQYTEPFAFILLNPC